MGGRKKGKEGRKKKGRKREKERGKGREGGRKIKKQTVTILSQ